MKKVCNGIRRFWKGFQEWWHQLKRADRVALLVGAIVWLGVATLYFLSIDTQPATAADYQALESLAVSIQENRDILLETDSEITVNKDSVTVKLKSKECSVIALYDNNFALLSTERRESEFYHHWVGGILMSNLTGLLMGLVALLVVKSLLEAIQKKKVTVTSNQVQ